MLKMPATIHAWKTYEETHAGHFSERPISGYGIFPQAYVRKADADAREDALRSEIEDLKERIARVSKALEG